MIKNIENIILAKEYFELTADELETVSELVQNAEEYEEMKWFLMSTQQALVNEKIEATPALKKSVMEHLNKKEDNRKFWLNGVTVFLFPQDKKLHQKPAFQMSIAALLLIGILLIYNRPIDDQQMVINDTHEQVNHEHSKENATAITENKDSESNDNSLLSNKTIEQEKSLDLDVENEESVTLRSERADEDASYFSHADGVYGQPFETTVDEIGKPIVEKAESDSKSNAQNRELNLEGGFDDTKVNTKILEDQNDVKVTNSSNENRDRNALFSKERKKMAKQKYSNNEVAEEQNSVDLDESEKKDEGYGSANGATINNNVNYASQPTTEDKVNALSADTYAFEIVPLSLSISQNKELNSLFSAFK